MPVNDSPLSVLVQISPAMASRAASQTLPSSGPMAASESPPPRNEPRHVPAADRPVVRVGPLVVVGGAPGEEAPKMSGVGAGPLPHLAALAQYCPPPVVVIGADAALVDQQGAIGVLVGQAMDDLTEPCAPRC